MCTYFASNDELASGPPGFAVSDAARTLLDKFRHAVGTAQNLTTEAEANLLKRAEIRGTLTTAQAARWTEVTAAYTRTQAPGGSADDPLARAVAALDLLADRITAVETAITRATNPCYLHAPRRTARGTPG